MKNNNDGEDDTVDDQDISQVHTKENDMNVRYWKRSDRYDLRPWIWRDYSQLFAMKNDVHQNAKLRATTNCQDKRNGANQILGYGHHNYQGKSDQANSMMEAKVSSNDDWSTILETPQMNMNQGLKMFGEARVEAVKNEMLQLHDRKVMVAREACE